MYELTVDCDCGNTIRLPVTKPPKQVIRQLPLTTGGLPTNALCTRCNHVSAYSPDKFHKKFFQRIGRDQLRGDQVCACVRVQCGIQGCGSLVDIRLRMRVSDDMREEALSLLGEAVALNARCDAGHLINGKALGSAFAVLVDPGWESLD
jgi:hypothetical protein